MSIVVHCRRNAYDVYIGRPPGNVEMHFGNPFTHQHNTKAAVTVSSREEAVTRFGSWLEGTTDQDLEPDRRAWILLNLHALRGKVLGCWCAPKACHGDVLVDMANKEEV